MMAEQVMSMEKLLEEHPFTHDLPASEREKLAQVAQLKEFPPGQFLVREGRVADAFYLILDGLVAVELHVPERGIIRLQTLGPGDAAGWSWITPPYRASFDIRSLDTVRAIVFDGEQLKQLLESDCALGYRFLNKMLAIVAERVRVTRLQLVDMYAPPGGAQ